MFTCIQNNECLNKTNVMLMNNQNDHSTSYRRLPDSTPSPILRRTKSVRASFRMLGSRWKSSTNGGNSKIDSTTGPSKKYATTSKDAVSERFGKDFNRNVKQPMTDTNDRLPSSMISPPLLPSTMTSSPSLPQSIPPVKTKTKFFHAFAKENINERHIQYEIPKNVAPKAAALLQIPVFHRRQHHHHQQRQQQQQQLNKNHDLIKTDGKFNVQLDRQACDLFANTNQFALLKSLSENSVAQNSLDMCKSATIRRAPYWPNNQPLKQSKNLGFDFLRFAPTELLLSTVLFGSIRAEITSQET